MRFHVDALAGLCLAALVAACGQTGNAVLGANQAAPRATSGPAADYPMVLGTPFVVDGVTYTPSDALNYDQVGYGAVGTEGGGAVSLAHRTLPLPSYVEVTSLKTGKTVLARVERRGPMTGANLIELSSGAAAQLGLSGEREAVRVRRVNPPEPERALLRGGQNAPARMDTPMSLVAVLLRKLEPAASAPPSASVPGITASAAAPAVPKPLAAQMPVPPVDPATTPRRAAPAVAVPKPAGKGPFAVQVAAFADAGRAASAARKLGGSISDAGKYHRVRITGFASAADAGAALAKARAAGYSDARILRAD